MVLTFNANEVRAQIAHAVGAAQHRAPPACPSTLGPALLLVKSGDSIHLVSDGLPATGKVANGVEFEPRLGNADAPEAASIGDFVEPIAINAFAGAVSGGREHLEVVVTRTYINVLGGQPQRPQFPAPYSAQHPRRQPAPRAKSRA